MDIALNITTAPQPLRSKAEKPTTPVKTAKKKSGAGAASGFSFEFGGGGQKVKALVARKRPTSATKVTPTTGVEAGGAAGAATKSPEVKKSLALRRKSLPAKGKPSQDAKPQEARRKSFGVLPKEATTATPTKSIAFKRKAATPKAKPRNFVRAHATAPKSDEGDSDLETYAKLAKPTVSGGDLMLNICTAPAKSLPARPPPKQKLNRAERMSQKKAQRQGTGPPLGPRTLSAKQLNEGIRKFSENPNRKPRAADLFDQQERQEHKAAQAVAAQASQSEAAPEPAAVDARARKTNAFRVRRPEDSTVKKIDLFTKNPEAKLMGQRLVKPRTERIFDGVKVDSLGLHAHALKNLADLLGITELTTVQQKTIPKALEGKDLLVRSQTGSGKTLAYALPVVEKLQEIRPKVTRDAGILAVIIVPTRELAIQTYELFLKLLKPYTWIVPGVLMGGESRKSEKARLRKGINVLVGTPGRLVDHLLHTESFKLCKSKFLILDEADRLLEMGYERDVKQIVEAIDKQRAELAEEETSGEAVPHLQRLLLSATLTAAVQKLAGLTLHEPIHIDNSDEDPAKAIRNASGGGYTKDAIELTIAEDLDAEDVTGILTIPDSLQLSYVVVPPKLRLVSIAGLLVKEFVGGKLKAIIFMSTMEMVNFHHDLLNEQLTRKVLDEDDEEEVAAHETSDAEGDAPLLKGLRFFKLHGSMTQTERQGVFKSFRDCKSGVLLATDVIGRGIDFPEIDLVVQYSPPQKTADFVHRVGRTARAGRSGRAVLFLAPSEVQFVRCLEDKRIRISQVDMDIYLKALSDADNEANTMQEAASNLQYKFQQLIEDDRELHDKACKAFVSWMKFYSTFPKELKPVFNIKNAHMGHFAKSFGLKDQPTSFTKKHSVPKPLPKTNRLTYTERDPEKLKLEKKNKKRRFGTTVTGGDRNSSNRPAPNRLVKMLPTSRALTTSEFDSGLPALKKRKV